MKPTILHLSDGSKCKAWMAGQGEPLVFFHGVGMCSLSWEPQVLYLSQKFHVIVVDLPGHGETQSISGKPSLPDYVLWAKNVLEALNLGVSSVVGHSMGALIVCGLAIEYPGLIKRAVLLNGVYKRSDSARKAVLKRANDILQGRGEITSTLSRWFGEQDSNIRERVRQWLESVSTEGYGAAYLAFAKGDEVYADRISEISCPLLVMTGSDDPNSTPKMAKDIAAAVKGAHSIVIEGHRHLINLTASERTNEILEKWLIRNEEFA